MKFTYHIQAFMSVFVSLNKMKTVLAALGCPAADHFLKLSPQCCENLRRRKQNLNNLTTLKVPSDTHLLISL